MRGRGTCVLRETLDRRSYVFSALDPIQGKGSELARTAWTPSILGTGRSLPTEAGRLRRYMSCRGRGFAWFH
jgi:hypothetical protein